jgi:hypothetical protein
MEAGDGEAGLYRARASVDRKRAQTNPTTACGTYGSSREVISAAESFTFTDARASSRCCSLVAPTIGAVMTGLESKPGQGYLRAWDAPCRGDRRYAIDDISVLRGGFREEPLVGVVGLGLSGRIWRRCEWLTKSTTPEPSG